MKFLSLLIHFCKNVNNPYRYTYCNNHGYRDIEKGTTYLTNHAFSINEGGRNRILTGNIHARWFGRDWVGFDIGICTFGWWHHFTWSTYLKGPPQKEITS